jgi:hypothetical protein
VRPQATKATGWLRLRGTRVVITDRFVYIHMPKTGGTFVETALAQLLRGEDGLYLDTRDAASAARFATKDQHQTVSEVPGDDRHKPIAFTVRNPYDHYVSFYEFGWWKDHLGDTFDDGRIRVHYPHYPELSFDEYLEAVQQWDLLDPSYADPALATMFDRHGMGPLTYDYIRFLSSRPRELVARMHRVALADRLRAETKGIRFLRAEALNDQLIEFLVGVGYPLERVAFIRGLGRIYPDAGRRRPPGDWRDYYTPASKRLVREREDLVFRLFPEYDV